MFRTLVLATTFACTLLPGKLFALQSDTTVISLSKPKYAAAAKLTKELTLGAGSAAAEFEFSTVYLFGAPNDGVFVLNTEGDGMVGGLRSSVRHYDRNGRLVRAIGRQGAGPGEYQGVVSAVRELPDGRILIADQRGILSYSAAGEPLGRWSTRTSSFPPTLYVAPQSGVFVQLRSFNPRDPTSQAVSVHRHAFDGTLLDSTLAPPTSPVAPPAVRHLRDTPFLPRFITAWSPIGYFVSTYSSRYAVDLLVPTAPNSRALWRAGDAVTSKRRVVPSVAVQRDEAADWKSSITATRRRAEQDPTWSWDGPEIPRSKPPVRGLFVDEGGRIWVGLSQPARVDGSVMINTRTDVPNTDITLAAERLWPEPQLFDVHEPSGTHLGQVRLPPSARDWRREAVSMVVRDHQMWLVEIDEDDVPTVSRYRISWDG